MTNFILPEIGEGIETVSISEIKIKVNDSLKKDDYILLVETDKASMEIPIDQDCIVKKILVNIGDLISPGQKIIEIETKKNPNINKIDTTKDLSEIIEPDNNADNNNFEIDIVEDNDIDEISKNNINSKNNLNSHASPSIRKLARELGCEINNIKGSGGNNRITKKDLYNYVKDYKTNNLNTKTKSNNLFNDLSKWGLVEKINLNSIRKTSASRLLNSWNTLPHVTQFDNADITELDKIVKLLKKVNTDKIAKVSYMPFFIKAMSIILHKIPIFNTSFNSDDGSSLIQKHYYNIGIAVNTDKGLIVPVIKNVNNKSIKSIAIELTTLIDKAKKGKLTIEEMSGGCITISSLGNLGGTYFTPIINSPEVAILGISKIEIKPIYKNKKFIARKILPISLSYDHRVINGADAVKFTNIFAELISEPSKL